MTEAVLDINTDQVKELKVKVEKLSKSLSDLRPLFEQFSADFYKDEKRVFQLSGPGQYQDLNPGYQEQKQNKYGFIYPILFASGRLASSLISRTAIDSVNRIARDHFEIGSKTPYAEFHHKGTSKMPRRPLFDESEDSPLYTRWNRITDAYLEKVAKGVLE